MRALSVRVGLALALAATLAACGSAPPKLHPLLEQVDKAMAGASSYRITGTDRAGETTSQFQVRVAQNGDFTARLVTRVPRSPSLVSRVVAKGDEVYVLAPTQLQELGITSLPGDLNPQTTWVEQPASVATSYRHSLQPFFGAGLGRTLRAALAGAARVEAGHRFQEAVWVVTERSRESSLRLWIASRSHRLRQLQISGSQPVKLRYFDFSGGIEIQAPPSSQVYAPPTPAPGS
ncbi:MAG: hypothetical protein ACREN4_06795 [Candidatus Dormibacteria bacterium]